MTRLWGSKFMAIIFSFIIHIEIAILISLVLKFLDWTLLESNENWYPMEIKLFKVGGGK